MRTTTKATVASVLLIALLGAGCGAQKAAQPANDQNTTQGSSDKGSTTPPSNTTTGATTTTPATQVPPADQWEMLSKWSDVQGTIVNVTKANDQVQAISILVEKDFKSPTSTDTTPDYPFKAGSTVEIAFDGKTASGDINPKQGDEVVLSVGQFGNAKDDKQAPFWGSSFDHYWYEKDHKFYNQKGDVYKVYTGDNMQQQEVYTQ